MGHVLAVALWIFVGLVIGLVAPVPFWRRQLRNLDFMWRSCFVDAVNQAIAGFFGGRVENGVILLPKKDGEDEEDPTKNAKENLN